VHDDVASIIRQALTKGLLEITMDGTFAARMTFRQYPLVGPDAQCMPRHHPHLRPAFLELIAGLPTSIFWVLEPARIRPNPTLYRNRANPEPAYQVRWHPVTWSTRAVSGAPCPRDSKNLEIEFWLADQAENRAERVFRPLTAIVGPSVMSDATNFDALSGLGGAG